MAAEKAILRQRNRQSDEASTRRLHAKTVDYGKRVGLAKRPLCQGKIDCLEHESRRYVLRPSKITSLQLWLVSGLCWNLSDLTTEPKNADSKTTYWLGGDTMNNHPEHRIERPVLHSAIY